MIRVYPSGRDLATRRRNDPVPTKAVFNDRRVSVLVESLGETRAARSPRPPAGTPTTILIGCDGASCARTDPAARQIETTSKATLNLRREGGACNHPVCSLYPRRIETTIPGCPRLTSQVRIDHDIDEPARPFLHLGERIIDLRRDRHGSLAWTGPARRPLPSQPSAGPPRREPIRTPVAGDRS